ncbi:hypothetical protein CXU17_03835 [Akkermansia muciniphila]|nr:hypothetical protein CXU17_03835 [Akkermansia muciniphila]
MLWFIICIVLMIFLGPDIGLICPILFIWYKVVFFFKNYLNYKSSQDIRGRSCFLNGFPQYIIMFFGAG